MRMTLRKMFFSLIYTHISTTINPNLNYLEYTNDAPDASFVVDNIHIQNIGMAMYKYQRNTSNIMA